MTSFLNIIRKLKVITFLYIESSDVFFKGGFQRNEMTLVNIRKNDFLFERIDILNCSYYSYHMKKWYNKNNSCHAELGSASILQKMD
jgi:hypothetical protein